MKNVALKFLALPLVFFPLYSTTPAEKIWGRLSEIEKISQIFLVNVEGNETFYPVEFLEDGAAVVPGGIILFSYNIGDSKEQLKNYISSINAFYKKNKSPLPFIAVDQEGGEVNRLKKITSHLPSEKIISVNYTLQEAKSIYSNQAVQMKELGVTMNLAPVAEAEIESNKLFLGTRTFGSVPKSVAKSLLNLAADDKFFATRLCEAEKKVLDFKLKKRIIKIEEN